MVFTGVNQGKRHRSFFIFVWFDLTRLHWEIFVSGGHSIFRTVDTDRLTRYFPLFSPLPDFLQLLIQTFFNRLFIGSLNFLQFLQHILDTVDSIALVDLDKPLNLLPLIKIIFVMLLAVEQTQHLRMVSQTIQLFLHVELFCLILFGIVVLDTHLVQLKQLGHCLLTRLLLRLKINLVQEQVICKLWGDSTSGAL